LDPQTPRSIGVRWPRASLRTYLVAIILVATVPLAVFASGQMLAALKQRHADLADGLQEAAISLAADTTRELGASIDALMLLARSESLAHSDVDAFNATVSERRLLRPGWSGVFLLGPDGSVLLDTTGRLAGRVGATASLEGLEPATWERSVRAGRPLVSNLIEPANVQRRTTVLAVPVMNGSSLRYVLGAYIGVDFWARLLHSGAPRIDTGYATLLDGQRRVIARTLAHDRFVGTALTPDAQPPQTRASGVQRQMLPDGHETYVTTEAVAFGGWSVRAGAAAEPLDRLERSDALVTLGVAIACLLLGVTAALLVARRVTVPLYELTTAGAVGPAAPISVTEIAQLRGALGEADTQRAFALEQMLRKAEEFETLFQSSPLGLVVAQDAACSRTMQNAAMDGIVPPGVWRLAASEAPDDIEVLHRGHALAPHERPLQRAAMHGESVSAMELELRRAGSPARFVLASADPLWDAEGRTRGAIGAVTDITERKRTETELAATIASEQAARHEAELAGRAKDEFLAMLGHELRNPLNAIATAIEVLNRLDASAPPAVRAREIIAHQSRHLAHLMDRLLGIGRVLANDVQLLRQPVDLAALVRNAMAAARFKADAKRLQLHAQLGNAWIDADPQRIGDVLEQLIDNAIRYTPEDGEVEIRLAADDGRARLSVRDNGPGIDAALLPRLFDPFVQGARSIDRRAGGLGIGLTLVKRLVELHGGAIDVRSNENGTIFELTLPLLERAAQPPASSPAARKRVVVIDDNPDVLDGLQSMLELDGHAVRTAMDGSAGLATLIATRPDAAIVDIGLPGIDGYELASRSRAAGYDGVLIALSGYGQDADIQQSLAAGFDAHMVKPVDPRRLAQLLAAHAP